MRYVLALCLLLAMLPTPAYAAPDRVLLDATVLAWPNDPITMCIRLDDGTIALTARLIHAEGATTPDGKPQMSEQPINIAVSAYRGRPDAPGIDTTATLAEAVVITPVIGGPYCLDIINRAYVPAGQNPSFWAQWVAIKLTHAP